VQGWRWPLIWAAAAAVVVGSLVTLLPPSLEWAELVFGIPMILLAFGFVLWTKGFTHEDRVLFRKHGEEEATLPPPAGALPPGR
jgi:hypothetical protein